MSEYFLIGAVVGSFVFIVVGRAPAQRLLDALQASLNRNRRRY